MVICTLMSRNVVIDGNRITDWESFHSVFSEALGFPTFYGRNLDAWIDCMTSLDDPTANMTSIHVAPGEIVALCVAEISDLRKRMPEIYDALIECTAFVNHRRVERGDSAILALSFST